MSDSSLFLGKKVNVNIQVNGFNLVFRNADVIQYDDFFLTFKDSKDGSIKQYSRKSIISLEVV